jgi:regulation of enolase protein 1 (concanavalin A-like superfamily)
MKGHAFLLLLVLILASRTEGATETDVIFHDTFQGRMLEGWTWVREDRTAWRITERGLEVRVQPGNMWGPPNNARNVLVRPLSVPAGQGVEITVRLENRPTEQYEQVDLVWYYDDSHMVKLGQEMVDGKLSIVMGREEGDKTRTITIIPIEASSLEVRYVVRGNIIEGSFRTTGAGDWQRAGQCDLPVKGEAKVSLQCYQGPAQAEHWARFTDLRVRAIPAQD